MAEDLQQQSNAEDTDKKPSKGLSERSGITFKSLLFSLIGLVVINSLAGINEEELGQGMMIGNFMPIAVYFFLFLLVCLWNPITFKLFKPLSFSRRETAAFFIFVLAGCWSPTSGLYRYFNRFIVAPVYLEAGKTDWREYKVREMLPKKLFPLDGNINAKAPGALEAPKTPEASEATETPLTPEKKPEDKVTLEKTGPPEVKVIPASGDSVYSGFVQGLTIKSTTMSGAFYEMQDVLWAWWPPMRYWGVLFVFFVLTILSLSMIFHRQWSKHEQLSYPLANIASAVIEKEEGKAFGKLFHSKLFWGGFAIPAFIHTLNILGRWFSGDFPSIGLRWYVPWDQVFPILNESGMWGIEKGSFFFCIVGVTYFVAAEVSFTIGISTILIALIGAQFYLATGRPLSRNDIDVARLGAYIAYGTMLAWAGRDYYWRVFSKALTLRRTSSEDEVDGVWAARFFFIFFVGMIVTMNVMGFEIITAVLFAASHLLMFTILTRIVCEAGMPFMQPFCGSGLGGVLPRLLGPAFFGAKPLVFFGWLSNVMARDPRECLMPYAANALKVGEDFKLKMRKFFFVIAIFLCVGLFVGFMAKSYTCYKYGAQKDWSWYGASSSVMNPSIPSLRFLEDTGQREISDAATGLTKFTLISPEWEAVTYFTIGLVLAFSVFLLRFRFANFPIHPLLFIIIATFPVERTWTCYLIGWAIKVLIVKFGGGKVYQELKPIFLGLIIGELVAAGTAMLIGFIYFWHTGLNPVWLGILPG